MEVSKIKSLFEQSKGMKKQIELNLENDKNNLSKLNTRIKLLEEAQTFLQKVATDTQSELKLQIEDIVNLALETVFPGEYSFQVLFNISRGKTEAELLFLDQKTGRQIDPMNASGGGVIDLTSFALRIASYALEQGNGNVIVLDEPFRFVSRDLVARAGEILKVLSEKLNLQIILVTHIPELIDVANKVFEVKKQEDGVSKIFIK